MRNSRSNLRLAFLSVVAMIAFGFFGSMNLAYAQGVVLCVKKIGKTNNKGRDAYVSVSGKCREPLYQAVEITAINSLSGPQGQTGAQGATGPQGPQGAAGPAGPAGANGFVDVGSCYSKTTVWDAPNGGSASAGVIGDENTEVIARCDDPTTQFVLEHGYSMFRVGTPTSSLPVLTDENNGAFNYPVGHKIGFTYFGQGCEGSCPSASVTIVCCASGTTTEPTPTD